MWANVPFVFIRKKALPETAMIFLKMSMSHVKKIVNTYICAWVLYNICFNFTSVCGISESILRHVRI